jgi:hypothetical protein
MITSLQNFSRKVLGKFGARTDTPAKHLNHACRRLSDQDCIEIFGQVQPFTMTGYERVVALIDAVQYVVLNRIPGDIVECGVWKGGSIMAAMLTLSRLGDKQRTIWLYDTFQGMTPPEALDISLSGERAEEIYREHQQSGSGWCKATIEEVKGNLTYCGYPPEFVRFVVGPVNETLLQSTPNQISLLRLDTDWYESTKCELEILYPKLARLGVLIVDDYGHWAGSKRAVDEFFEKPPFKPLFHRIDYSGRLIINV